MGFLHDASNLVVDTASRIVGVILRVAVITAQKHFVIGLAEHLHAQVGAHAVIGNHGASHLRCALKVVGSTRGNVVAEQLFGNTTAKEHSQLVAHFVAAVEHLVFVGNGKRVTQGTTTRNDRDLMNGIGAFKHVANQSMARLMVRNGLARTFIENAAFALRTGDNTLHGVLNFLVGDDVLVATSRKNCRLVEQVGQISTRKARGELGDAGKINVIGQGLVGGMNV